MELLAFYVATTLALLVTHFAVIVRNAIKGQN